MQVSRTLSLPTLFLLTALDCLASLITMPPPLAPQVTTTDWTGVGLLSVNGSPNCSAIAIAPGALLTAAHCVAPAGASSVQQNVTALLRSVTNGTSVTVTAASVIPYPTFQASYLGGDLAVIMLNQNLPSWVAIYGIYALNDEMGQIFQAAGFAGATVGGFHDYENRFENNGLFWADDWISFDYDSGLAANNALGSFGFSDLGVVNEGMIEFGDSGGPALINGMVVGVPSGVWRYEYAPGQSADVDGVINSSIGEIGFMVRVSRYREWILQTIAANSTGGSSGASSSAVPEPSTYWLGAAGMLLIFRRVMKNRQ